MKGKLVAFTPKLNNGVQETYQGEKGLLYKFVVTFNTDGADVIGTANSSKQTPSWKVGDEYTYEERRNTSSQGTVYISFSGIKSVNATPFGGKKSDPSFIIQKGFECAVECAVKFWNINLDTFKPEYLDAMINSIFERIMKLEKENERWAYISAIRLATLKYELLGAAYKIEGKHSKWLTDSAEAIYNATLEVCKPVQDEQNSN